MWQRQYFDIEATTEEEAKNIAMQFLNKEAAESDYFDRLDNLTDTEEIIQVSELHPDSTVQLFLAGEKTPFAQNGQAGAHDYDRVIHQQLMVQVDDWLKQGTGCETVVSGKMTYHICHIQGRLCVVAVKGQTEAVRYLFVESWEDIVSYNDIFKQEMFEYLLRKKLMNGKERDVVKWIVGRNKELEDVPFDIEDFITVWAHRAAKEECKPTILLGYQIADGYGNIAEGFRPTQVIKDIRKAEEWAAEARNNESDKKGYHIYPVYVGDIKEPVLI